MQIETTQVGKGKTKNAPRAKMSRQDSQAQMDEYGQREDFEECDFGTENHDCFGGYTMRIKIS